LDRIQNGPLPEEIASAQASLAEAQADLQRVLEGPDDQELIAAEAELGNADAARRQAQAAYDAVAGDPNLWKRPEPAQLEQATNNFIAAQARLEDLKKGSTAAQIAAARARVQRAQAQLDLLQAVNPADVAAAQAEIRQAQAQLDLLKAGTRPETIAVAQADVAAAEASLAEAQAALEETVLRAPFAGTIASLDANPGEQVVAGTPFVRLADLTRWQIETEDLTEFDVIGIERGDEVAITFDAISDLEKRGVVNRVRPIGEDLRGDIVYTLVIDPDQQDERLLWNLTAVVTIEAE
jgi:multidrug resistance efflux pump